jgi:hypothetical protein
LAIACGLVWLAKCLYNSVSAGDSGFREKFAELLLQLALIVVVGGAAGGVVKAAVDWIARQRIRQREHADRQLDLFRRVRGMHVAIENSRTVMRAHRQTPHKGASTYHEQSMRLIELRPEMEEVSQELTVGKDLFLDQATIASGLARGNYCLPEGW